MAITYSGTTGGTAITMDLANLASSSTFVAGRESSQIDNTSNLYEDAAIQGNISVGTTPTAGTNIIVWAYSGLGSLGTTAIDVLDGTDSAETIQNEQIRKVPSSPLSPSSVSSVL